MNTLLPLALTFAIGGGQEPAETPTSLISKMVRVHYDAQTTQGTIISRQSVKNFTVTTKTEVAIDRPARIRIAQTRDGSEARTWLAVADSDKFSYDRPPGVNGRPRFVEPQFQKGRFLDTREVYMVVGPSLGDKSPVLDILIGRTDDLRLLRQTWGTQWEIVGKVKIREQECTVIRGSYEPAPLAGQIGQLEMVISPTFQLMRYTTGQKVVLPESKELVLIRTEWDVDVRLNGEIDPKLFAG
ncbi:MAG: hypothetical protein SFX74_00710 [Fimbriimonadaceae bacterium]|nr:hypothetical protein [Fimbriimonadaceae bacterium]